MATLADIRKEAIEVDAELMRADTLGTLPPTHAELRDFCGLVMDAHNDDCERCGDVDTAARDFGRAVEGWTGADVTAEGCGEALAQLLATTDMFSIRDARSIVDMFAAKVVEAMAEQKGAA